MKPFFLVLLAIVCPVLSSSAEDFSQLKQSYDSAIRPIIQAKCLDCHGTQTVYPWYYKIPGVKQLIDHDIEEAREHLDLSHGFPFQTKSTVIRDLKSLRKEIAEDKMPIFIYRVMHPSSRVNASEKDAILRWVDESLATLSASATN